MRAIAIAALAALSVCGCASSGVVQTDPGTYMIAMKNTGGILGNVDKVKAEAYQEAGEFCAKDGGKIVQTVEAKSEGAIPFVRMGGASLTFRCVEKAARAD